MTLKDSLLANFETAEESEAESRGFLSEPIRFIDWLDGETSKHVVLFHEDPMYAFKLESRFIRNGLQRGEFCAYATVHNPDAVEVSLQQEQIECGEYKRKNLLAILKIDDPRSSPGGLEMGFQNINKDLFRKMKSPFRMVVDSRVFEVNTGEYLRENAEAERMVQDSFDGHLTYPEHVLLHNLKGKLLCSYSIRNMVPLKHGQWFFDQMRFHHGAIFAPKRSIGLAFMIR